MTQELLYATNNKGKVAEVSKLLEPAGIRVVSPKDLGINLKVEESGKTLAENATLKAKAFLEVSGGRIVLADDSGLEIDALNGEPGIHVRRWKDGQTELTDEEVRDYCLQRMAGVPKGERGAQFKTVLVLTTPDGKTELFDDVLRGEILEEPGVINMEGYPFESLFFIPEWNMLLGEVHQLTGQEKEVKLTHREKAVKKAIPRISQLLGQPGGKQQF